jgi:hypothetical protein
MGKVELTAFLGSLAVPGNVAASPSTTGRRSRAM